MAFYFTHRKFLPHVGHTREVSIEIYKHLLFLHWHIHAFEFVYLYITPPLTCLWVYHTFVACILVYHTEEKILMKMYTHFVFRIRNITPNFSHSSCGWFCFLAINPILPYQNVLVRHTHPQLKCIRVSQLCRYAGCVHADLFFFHLAGKFSTHGIFWHADISAYRPKTRMS